MTRKPLTVLLLTLAIGAGYAMWAQQQNATTMNDHDLEAKIDALCDKRQPASAAPLIAEARRRAEQRRDTRWMFKLIRQEIQVNAERLQRDEARTPERELRTAAEAAWTPLRQMLMLEVYGQSNRRADALSALASPDTLSLVKATDVGLTPGALSDMTVHDYLALSLAMGKSVEDALDDERLETDATEGERADEPDLPDPFDWWLRRHDKGWCTPAVLAALKAPIDQFAASEVELPLPLEATRRLARQAQRSNDPLTRLLAATLRVCVLDKASEVSIDSLAGHFGDEITALPATTAQEKALHDLVQANVTLAQAKKKSDERDEANALCDTALRLLDNVKRTLGRTPFATCAGEVADKIKLVEVGVTTPRQMTVGQTIPIYIGHRNTPSVEVRMLTWKEGLEIGPGDDIKKDDLTARLSRLPVVATHRVTTPAKRCRLRSNTLLTELPGLPAGQYIAALYPTSGKTSGPVLAFSRFVVSDLAADAIRSDGRLDVLVTNAATGEARADVQASAGKMFATGWLNVPTSTEHLTLTRGNDKLEYTAWNNRYMWSPGGQPKQPRLSWDMVTDRNIYRPGQTIGFKVYLYEAYQTRLEAAGEKRLRIELHASNGQKLAQTTVATGLYGTASGELDVPADAYKGAGYLLVTLLPADKAKETCLGNHPVRIEDFKRTDNTLTFQPFEGVILPGSRATVRGTLRAASGLAAIGAQGSWIARRDGSIVAQGACSTDNAGIFEASFEVAEPGHYHVSVTLTDNRGETEASETVVTVLDAGVELLIARLNDDVTQGQAIQARLRVTNCNGRDATRPVRLELRRLPERPALRRAMPFDVDTVIGASTLTPRATDEPGELVWSHSCDVDGELNVTVGNTALPAGAYLLTATTEGYDGSTVTTSESTRVLPAQGGCKNLRRLELFAPDTVAAGDTLRLRVASGLAQARVHVVAIAKGKALVRREVRCSQSVEVMEVPISMDAIAGESVEVLAVCHQEGQAYSARASVKVVKHSEPLRLELTTWRDHTQPGATETWQLTATPGDNMEVAASIYDTRLDKYVSNTWRTVQFRRVEVVNRASLSTMQPRTLRFTGRNFYSRDADSNLSCDLGQWLLTNLYDGLAYAPLVDRYGVMPVLYACDAAPRMMMKSAARGMAANQVLEEASTVEEATLGLVDTSADETQAGASPENGSAAEEPVALRQNFAETVLFEPALMPDAAGHITLRFTLPDNLTEYELRCLAHDRSMRRRLVEQRFQVRKALNARLGTPRFVCEGDTITLTADVASTDSAITTATAQLQLTDLATHRALPAQPTRQLDLTRGAAQAAWQVVVPDGLDTLRVALTARGGGHTDGEQWDLPVARRCVEVNEGDCFTLFDQGEQHIKNPYREGSMSTLTLHYTSNTFIEVLRALPSLNESWVPCADTYLGRFETAVIARHLKRDPTIMRAVDYLSKHPTELPTVAEASSTPWLYVARQMRTHDADVVHLMSGEHAEKSQREAIGKLRELQRPGGGIPWFADMDVSPFMTAAVVSTLTDLVELGLVGPDEQPTKEIRRRAIPYLDAELEQALQRLEKREKEQDDLVAKGHPRERILLDWLDLSLLAARVGVDPRPNKVISELLAHVGLNWQYGSINDRIDALDILRRVGRQAECNDIVKSLRENLVEIDAHTLAVGERSLWGRRSQILAEARLIMVLRREYAPDLAQRLVNHLVSVKRGEAWPDAQCTGRAVLALLDTGSAWGLGDQSDCVSVAGQTVEASVEQPRVTIALDPAKPPKEAVVTKGGSYPTWGSWQRTLLSDVNRLAAAGSGKLSVTRSMEVREVAGDQERWKPVGPDHTLGVGDEVRVTLSFSNDEPLSFVRLIDHRAAALEPLDKLSGYRGWWFWRWCDPDDNTPAHYLAIADRQTEMYIDHLQRGRHKITYRLRVTHEGAFTGGYTEAVCLYDTEIKAHSAGSTLNVVAGRGN